MRQRVRSSQQETSKTINKEGKIIKVKIKVEHFSAGLNKINNLQKNKTKTKTGSAQNVRVKNSNDIIDTNNRSVSKIISSDVPKEGVFVEILNSC